MKLFKISSPLFRPQIGLRVLDLLVCLFWMFVLADSYIQGRELPGLLAETELPELPWGWAVLVIVTGSVVIAGGTFWQRQNIMQTMPVLRNALDRVFGEGSYLHLTYRMRPVLMSVLTSIVLAAVGLYTNFVGKGEVWSYAIFSGFVFFGLTMLSVLLISRRFPPELK